MFNISERTKITGWSGKRGKLSAALADKNLHSAPKYNYFGKHVQRGTVSVTLNGKTHSARFYSQDGWLKEIEISER